MLCRALGRPQLRHGEVVAAGQRRIDKARADQRHVDTLACQVDQLRLHQVTHGCLGRPVGSGTGQGQPGYRTADHHQVRAHACPQQGQGGGQAVAHAQQVGAYHAFDKRRVEVAGLQVFTSACIEDRHVQPTPGLLDAGGHLCHLCSVGNVALGQQHLPRIPLGQRQRCLAATATQRDLVPLFQQRLRQGCAKAAASACQPAAAHASLPLSQRMAPPISGTCSYNRAPASKKSW